LRDPLCKKPGEKNVLEFQIFHSCFCHISRRKKETKEREKENLFRPLWLTSFFWGCCFSAAHFLARAIWRQSATDFFFYMSFPLLRLPCSAFPLDTFAVFHFFFFTLCRTDYLIVSLFVSFIFFTSTVYVFLGEPHNLYDFMTTMQMMRLFTKGEYMVISVDWETYSPDRAREYLWS
jgi:hypothetical protein